jgi:hypothetical protein
MRYRVKIAEAPELFKVKITQPPKAKTGYQVEGSLANDLSAFGGGNLKLTEPKAVARTTITKVPREEANLEAEGGETVLTFDPSGYPLFYEIKGPRHSANGVPLNLPDDSFIFSDTKEMMIKDPQILKMFNKAPKKGGYTPADLSKQFIALNKYRMTMQDPSSDKVQIKTAELMIKKIIIKLGALSLAQEAKKGFPQGIPSVAKQYMEANGISEQDILPDQPEQESPAQEGQAIDMGQAMAEGAPQQAMEANEPPMMPDGSPVAMPEEQGMEQPPMQPGMRRGGMLRYANKGLEVALNKITANVKDAIDQGREMDDILIELMQNRVTPEDLITVLSNLAIPEMKAKEMVTDALNTLQQQAAQQRQMMQQKQGAPMGQPGMQAPQPGQPSPEQMMAMAQQMQPQQMQQAPMAMYGMEMGGYGMPFYNNPNQMAYGGVFEYDGGGETVKGKKGNVSANKATDKKTFESHKGIATKTASGKDAKYLYEAGQERKSASTAIGGGGGRPSSGWEDAICNMIKNGATYEELTNPDVAFEKTGSRNTHMAPGAASKAIFDRCNTKDVEEKFKEKEEAIYIDEEPPPPEEPPTEEECVCIDPTTGQESVFPKNADGTCPPCEGYELEPPSVTPQPQGLQYLPEDKLNLGIAMAQRNVNVPPVYGKAPGVREQAQRTDYIAQAELAKGQTQATINAIQKTAANNPGGAIAAMMAAQRGSQGDIINLASQVNAQNADRATALNKANTQHQYNQLLMDKDASDVYNQRNAVWQNNKAQDYNNYWANVGDKFAAMKGNARTLAAVNQAQGMKWNIDPVTGEEYYINTNNKAITPEKPAEDFATRMERFKGMGITDNSDVLKAMDLERKMNMTKFGGIAYKNGGYVYADILYPFIL